MALKKAVHQNALQMTFPNTNAYRLLHPYSVSMAIESQWVGTRKKLPRQRSDTPDWGLLPKTVLPSVGVLEIIFLQMQKCPRRGRGSHLTSQTALPKLPFPSLGFFFIPNSGDPLEIGDCWVFGLRPTEKKKDWNRTLKMGKKYQKHD